MQIPAIGRIVHYRLDERDVETITQRRETHPGSGNPVKVGQLFPMIIVAVWGVTHDSYVNGTVFLDGDDLLRVTSVRADPDPTGKSLGHFTWPSVPARDPAEPSTPKPAR
jgi:hypothetical protein